MAIDKKQGDGGGGGAPEWMVTYGDMVTLLLTFFVLLLTFMEPIKEDEILAMMETIREAFGNIGGVSQIPADEMEVPKNVPLMTILQIPILPEDFSPTKDDGPVGKRPKVQTIRPANYYQSGGRFRFAELSAELSEQEKQRIREYAKRLRGHATLIEVRGHCSPRPVKGTKFRDHFDLSYQRARAVADELIRAGIDPMRLIVVAAGTNEPVDTRVYDRTEREKNDLVELLQVDRTVDQFRP